MFSVVCGMGPGPPAGHEGCWCWVLPPCDGSRVRRGKNTGFRTNETRVLFLHLQESPDSLTLISQP